MAGTDLFKQASSFVDALELLSAGERAALKRDVGKTLSFASGNALVAFYRALPNGVSAGPRRQVLRCGLHQLSLEDCATRGKQETISGMPQAD
jgi:hypothetical protein